MSNSNAPDLRIVERILTAIEKGGEDYQILSQSRGEFQALYKRLKVSGAEDTTISKDLASILTDNPEYLTATIIACIEDVLEFVTQELERFQEIKRERPLSATEKRIGEECLLPLLASLSELVKQDSDEIAPGRMHLGEAAKGLVDEQNGPE